MSDKIKITYATGECWFSDIGPEVVYFFYPNGVWDDDKLLLSEALKKYPKDKYEWEEMPDE